MSDKQTNNLIVHQSWSIISEHIVEVIKLEITH